MLFAVLAFAVVFVIFVGTYWVLQILPEQKAERDLERRLQPVKRRKLGERLELLRRVNPISTVPFLRNTLGQIATTATLERKIEQSGLPLTVGRMVLATGFLAMVAFFATLTLSRMLPLAVAAAGIAASIPWFVLKFAATRRINKLEEQFPEAIELIARALRSGHAFTTGIGMVAEEMPEPVKDEFKLMHDRQNFGMPLAEAMKGFAERMPILDARFFVTAVLTQRESGGNLSEVLDSLAAIIRDRFRLRRQVRSLSAHGRITGLVLFCLAPALTGLLMLIAPQHMKVLFTDPIGVRIVMIVVVLQAIGFYAMRRIVDIEI
jgi:tight adherence protein B